MDLHTLLIQEAQEAGFPLAGTIDIDRAFSDSSHTIQNHIDRFDRWLESGFAGNMDYLARGRDRRSNPRAVFPEAQSLLCVALPYRKKSNGSESETDGPRYARYLDGEDYHQVISEKLGALMEKVSKVWQASNRNHPALHWKVCTDTSAVLERSWAALAGLGWIGKNTLLIHPKYGSYLLLGEVLLSERTGHGPAPLPNYCGHCTRCLQSCPTNAFIEPHVLNSNRCISYWTLEKRGELPLLEEDRKKIGPWIAGCDVCQEVCPFNVKPTRLELQNQVPIHESATDTRTWEALLNENSEDYRKRVKRSSLKRVKPEQFRRNLAITLSNTIIDLSGKERTVFQAALAPWVRKHLDTETDDIARMEWQRCATFFGFNDEDQSAKRKP